MKTQIKVLSAIRNQIDVTIAEDTEPQYIDEPTLVTVNVVFPDQGFFMNIEFPIQKEVTEENIMEVLQKYLFEMDDVIFNPI